MMRRLFVFLVMLLAAPATALPQALSTTTEAVDLDFANGNYWQTGIGASSTVGNYVTTTRAAPSVTDLIPASASGYAYQTFGANVPRITPTKGLLAYQALTNYLLNSAAPATQTTGSLATGTYTLWVNGSGTATMSAGSATGCGTAAASQGTVATFTITGAGTCTVTVAGSLNAFQLDNTNFGGALCPTTGATSSCAADKVCLTTVPVSGTGNTIYAVGTPYITGGTIVIYSDVAGTGSDSLFINGNVAKGRTGTAAGGGFNVNGGGTWTNGVSGRLAMSDGAGAQNAAFNGGSPAATAHATPTGMNGSFCFGSDNNGFSNWNGTIAQGRLWNNTAFSLAVLQTMTKP